MNPKDIGDRIYALIKKNKKTAKEVARATGINEGALSSYKKGTYAPSAEAIIYISKFFDVTTDWLLMGEGEMYKSHSPSQSISSENAMLLSKINCLDELSKALVLERINTLIEIKEKTDAQGDPHQKPKLTALQSNPKIQMSEEDDEDQEEIAVFDLPASAGFGNYLDGESTYELLSFNANEIPNGADYGIRISGNSMEPLIHDEQIVWVKEQVQIENGQIGIFIVNGDAYCKKLEIDYDEREMRLISLNKNYKPIVLKADIHNLRTVGRVLL